MNKRPLKVNLSGLFFVNLINGQLKFISYKINAEKLAYFKKFKDKKKQYFCLLKKVNK